MSFNSRIPRTNSYALYAGQPASHQPSSSQPRLNVQASQPFRTHSLAKSLLLQPITAISPTTAALMNEVFDGGEAAPMPFPLEQASFDQQSFVQHSFEQQSFPQQSFGQQPAPIEAVAELEPWEYDPDALPLPEPQQQPIMQFTTEAKRGNKEQVQNDSDFFDFTQAQEHPVEQVTMETIPANMEQIPNGSNLIQFDRRYQQQKPKKRRQAALPEEDSIFVPNSGGNEEEAGMFAMNCERDKLTCDKPPRGPNCYAAMSSRRNVHQSQWQLPRSVVVQ